MISLVKFMLPLTKFMSFTSFAYLPGSADDDDDLASAGPPFESILDYD